jgi:8-oxo-dGTP pyrophosphatase MutT (NUDIX family)
MADPADSLALWLAALRELFEETGVLLAIGATGRLVTFDDPLRTARLAEDRLALQAGRRTLWEIARREGLVPAPEQLRYWAHWITPEALPRRFNTRFFLAVLPPGQEALHCQVETTDGVWIAPSAALAQHAAGDFPLVFATRTHLERLVAFPSLDALLACAATKPVVTVLPWFDTAHESPRLIIPDEVRDCW